MPNHGGGPDVNPDDPPPQLRLQGVWVPDHGEAIALIENRKYRIGDRLRESGWVIVDISVEERSVTVVHPDTDRRAVLKLRRPGR